jgi:hypothetical protein
MKKKTVKNDASKGLIDVFGILLEQNNLNTHFSRILFIFDEDILRQVKNFHF